MTLDELRAHCRELIAYFKLPERSLIVDGHSLQRHRQGQPPPLGALIADGS